MTAVPKDVSLGLISCTRMGRVFPLCSEGSTVLWTAAVLGVRILLAIYPVRDSDAPVGGGRCATAFPFYSQFFSTLFASYAFVTFFVWSFCLELKSGYLETRTILHHSSYSSEPCTHMNDWISIMSRGRRSRRSRRIVSAKSSKLA